MPFRSALSSAQLDKLRGTASVAPNYRAATYVSACPNTNIYTARVNQTSFGNSFAQVTYDGGSGVLADVHIGMTVLISHTNDRAAAFFVGRVRKTPTATILYINETSADVQDDDYIFVLDDFRIWDKLGVWTGETLAPDFDVSFRELLPLIYNLRSAYADWVTSSVYSIEFAPLAIAATSGAAISTWLWDVDDGSITVGNTGTQDITVEFPAGFRWVSLTVTDDGGLASTRRIPVWAHDPSSFPPTLLNVGEVNVTLELDTGPSASLPAFDGVSAVLDNTLLCVWQDETYNETDGSIYDDIAFVGRIRLESNQTSYDDETGQEDAVVQFEIEGPVQQLARLEIQPMEILNDATPTAFNQINNATPWRAIFLFLSEFSTFHELHSIEFDSTSDAFEYVGFATEGGNLLDAVNSIADGINAKLQMNYAGEAEFVRNANMLESGARSALTTIADWDTQDVIDLSYEHGHVLAIGLEQAHGGSYNPSTTEIAIADSIAPGLAPDYPAATVSLNGQILAADATQAEARTELNQRSGHALAAAQERDALTITHPDGYWPLIPALDQWYSFTLDGSETVRGVVLTTATRWILVSVTTTHNIVEGTKQVEARYEKETTGVPGQTIIIDTNWDSLLPSFNISFPPLALIELPAIERGNIARGTTTIAAFNMDGFIYRTADWGNLAGPTWERVSMGVGTAFLRMEVDPASPLYLGTGNKVNAWVATSTELYYLEDIFEVDGSLSTTSQHTFNDPVLSGDIPGRTIWAQRSTNGRVAVASYYHDDPTYPGVWVTFTTDNGATWTEVQVDSGHHPSFGGNQSPGCYVSVHTNGLVLTQAYPGPGSSASPKIYQSDDGGATWAVSSKFVGIGGTDHLHGLYVPYNDNDNDDLAFSGADDSGGGLLYKHEGGAKTEVQPNPGSGDQTTVWGGKWAIHAHPLDRSRMVLAAQAPGFQSLWSSVDGGDTWILKQNSTPYVFAGMSGNEPDVVYMCGTGMGYSVDGLDTIHDMTGNIAADWPSFETFHFLVGG